MLELTNAEATKFLLTFIRTYVKFSSLTIKDLHDLATSFNSVLTNQNSAFIFGTLFDQDYSS